MRESLLKKKTCVTIEEKKEINQELKTENILGCRSHFKMGYSGLTPENIHAIDFQKTLDGEPFQSGSSV